MEDFSPDTIEKYYNYLEQSQVAKTKTKKKEFLNKALEIKPDDLDVNLMLLKLDLEKNIFKTEEVIDSLIEKEKESLIKEKIYSDSIGDFWLVFETRPYMRALNLKLDLLLKLSRTNDAIKLAESMLELCENDNLGIRYTLMALYAEVMDLKKAVKLLKKYDQEESPFFLLPFAIMYYQLGDYDKCNETLEKLNNENEHVLPLITLDFYLEEKQLPDFYSFGSVEEAHIVIYNNKRSLLSMDYFVKYLKKQGYNI